MQTERRATKQKADRPKISTHYFKTELTSNARNVCNAADVTRKWATPACIFAFWPTTHVRTVQ